MWDPTMYSEYVCVANRNCVLYGDGPVRSETFRGLMFLQTLCLCCLKLWKLDYKAGNEQCKTPEMLCSVK
jgi:hypothetical protein